MGKIAGNALWYASEELQEDRKIVKEAIKNDADAFQYASKELQNDPEIKNLLN